MFVFHRGQFLGSRVFSASRVITIGQSQDAAICLEAPEVAFRHAVLYVDGGRLIVADQGGTSGVFVNGTPVSSVAISGRDEIRIGEFRLKVEVLSGSAVFRPPAEPPRGVPPRSQRDLRSANQPFAPARAPTVPSMKPAEERGSSGLADLRRASSMNVRRTIPQTAKPIDRSLVDDLMASPEMPTPFEEEVTVAGDAHVAVDTFDPEISDTAPAGLREALEEPPLKTPVSRSLLRDPPPVPMMTPPPRIAMPPVAKELPLGVPVVPRQPTGQAPAVADTAPPPPAAPKAEQWREDVAAGGAAPEIDLVEEEDEDEDDQELDFEAPFSLLDNVVRERFRAPIKAEHSPVVEVIRYRDGRLVDLGRVDRGAAFRFFDPSTGRPFELLRHARTGRARLFFTDALRGNVVIGGQTTPLLQMCDDAHRADKHARLFVIDLVEGDFAHVKLEDEGYLIRFVRSPLSPPVSYSAALSREDKLYAGSAILGIAIMLVAIWLQAMLSPPQLFAMEQEVEFAQVSLKDLALEKDLPPAEIPAVVPPAPEPEPEPPAMIEPPPVPEEAPPAPEVAPEEQKKPRRGPRRIDPAAEPPPPPPKTAAESDAESALAALENMVPAAGDRSLSQKVSNVAAVKVPTGSAKRFQISGPIGKLPGNEVVLTPGTGRDTRSATRLLQERSVAELSAGDSSGKVRGTVAQIPARQIGTSGGVLSREEILKVVSAGIPDIQRCYERELMKSPELNGKVVFDWVISAGGSVDTTRVRSSTLRSEPAAACISQVIKAWKFPKPSGGAVKVTFPFTFRAQTF